MGSARGRGGTGDPGSARKAARRGASGTYLRKSVSARPAKLNMAQAMQHLLSQSASLATPGSLGASRARKIMCSAGK